MKKVVYGLIGLAVAASVMAAPKDAAALLTLQLTDGVATVTVVDGGVGDSNAVVGAVTYIGGVGAVFAVNVSTGLSKPVLGSAAFPEMDLNSVNVNTGAGLNTLTIKLTDTDFTANGSAQAVTDLGGTLTAGAGSSISFSAYTSNSNTAFATTNQIGSTLTFGPGAFSGTTGGPVPLVAPFSMTQVAVLTFNGPGSASFDGDTRIPEPATLALLGTGLVGFGWLTRRRQQSA